MTDRRLALRRAVLCGAGFLAGALLLLCLARFDNKYTKPGDQPVAGLLYLSQDELDRIPVHYLIDQWEYYPDLLLSPADFAAGQPDAYRRYLSVGQYSGMELDDPTRWPMGQEAGG